jgi:sugar phosphate isomerase/epimerase
MHSIPSSSFPRRDFLKTLLSGTTALATVGATGRLFAADIETTLLTKARPRIKLGLDNFAVRAMGWKAPQLLDYAASLNLDTLFISDLDAYDSLDDAHLKEVKAKADQLKIELYAGSWSICPTSTRFKKNWGTAEEHLTTGIRVAKTLGSPVFRVDPRRRRGSQNARRNSRAHGRHRQSAESM